MTGAEPTTGTVTASAHSSASGQPDGPEAGLPTRLATPGPDRDRALRELHALMVRGCRHQVFRMRGMLPGFDARACDDLALAAADDAVVALLGKLHTFEGRSRFTTWAYKFAILQAATEVRRQAWARREVPLEDPATVHWSGAPADRTFASPAEVAEASELAAEVGRALDVALTAYQRRIAVALLVDEVPIDVLADRLGTTRGALYKTLHVARSRLRAHLVSSGLLEAPQERAGGPGPAAPSGRGSAAIGHEGKPS
jgi:RNA polymerase sigma-70 factor (ECF subfamily)